MRNSITGIDIGTHTTKVVVAEQGRNGVPKLIGCGSSKTNGMRHGYTTSVAKTTDSIRQAIAKAEKSAKQKIRRAYISLGAQSLSTDVVHVTIAISKGDGEVTPLDIDKLIEKAENTLLKEKKNRHIMHSLPMTYYLDGKEIHGRPLGLYGDKLEAHVLFVSTFSHHFDDIVQSANDAGIDVLDVVAAPVAQAIPLLSEKQKTVGVGLVDIGDEITHITIYENDTLIGIKTLPVGVSDVVNDIALGLQVSLEDAESLFKELGVGAGRMSAQDKKIASIAEARTSEIFEMINGYLKKMRREALLPAGIIVAGGGAHIYNIKDTAKEELQLPVHIMDDVQIPSQNTNCSGSSWLTAYGLCFLESDADPFLQTNAITKVGSQIKKMIGSFLHHFMP